MWPSQSNERSIITSTKVLTNGDTIFNAKGDVQILNLYSECVTPNGATATTIQYSITPIVGAATAISGVSAALTSAVAGTIVVLDGSALSTAPAVSATSVALAQTTRGIIFMEGALKLVVATGPTTGTWVHYIRYRPLQPGAYVDGV